MRSGAQQSLVGLIRQAHEQSPWPIWLCGGDSPQLLPNLQAQLGVGGASCPQLGDGGDGRADQLIPKSLRI